MPSRRTNTPPEVAEIIVPEYMPGRKRTVKSMELLHDVPSPPAAFDKAVERFSPPAQEVGDSTQPNSDTSADKRSGRLWKIAAGLGAVVALVAWGGPEIAAHSETDLQQQNQDHINQTLGR